MRVGTYRKKPVVVEAFQYLGPSIVVESEPAMEIDHIRQFGASVVMVAIGRKTHGGLPEYAPTIRTLEGNLRVHHGDWIIRGVKGEFYPCKPDIFEATYEVADAGEGDG